MQAKILINSRLDVLMLSKKTFLAAQAEETKEASHPDSVLCPPSLQRPPGLLRETIQEAGKFKGQL